MKLRNILAGTLIGVAAIATTLPTVAEKAIIVESADPFGPVRFEARLDNGDSYCSPFFPYGMGKSNDPQNRVQLGDPVFISITGMQPCSWYDRESFFVGPSREYRFKDTRGD